MSRRNIKDATNFFVFNSYQLHFEIASWWQVEKAGRRVTIVMWKDEKVTTVRQYLRDANDPEAAIAAAYMKKLFGSRAKIKKHIEETHLKNGQRD